LVGSRQAVEDVLLGDESETHEVLAEPSAGLLLLVQGLFQLLLTDQFRLGEKFADFQRH